MTLAKRLERAISGLFSDRWCDWAGGGRRGGGVGNRRNVLRDGKLDRFLGSGAEWWEGHFGS